MSEVSRVSRALAVARDVEVVAGVVEADEAVAVEAQGDGVAPGDQLTLGVRAEHVSLQHGETANDNVIDASVSHVEYLGDVAIVYASMPGVAGMLAEMLAVKLPAEDGVRRAGDAMRLHLPPQRCLLFDAAGQALARTFAAPAQPFM